MCKNKVRFMFFLAGAGAVAASAARADEFATIVVDYSPAAGQFVTDPNFNDPARALGAPVGGGINNADNTSAVTLGGVGGSITLGFDHTVLDHPNNPLGMDAIVFGNAFYLLGDPEKRWAEAALIEISYDANNNNIADDSWFTIPGSSLTAPITLPLPSVFDGPVLINDPSAGAGNESYWGYADMSPVLILGDTDADNVVDNLTITAEEFYTVPDNPMTLDIDPGSGGGDAFDIAWAIDPLTGDPAGLPGFDFIRITTAVDATNGALGEMSAEIDAVSDVLQIGFLCLADVNGDGVLTQADFTAWLDAYQNLHPAADQNGDGIISPADFTAWLANFDAGCTITSTND
jgi:hypothetical protein